MHHIISSYLLLLSRILVNKYKILINVASTFLMMEIFIFFKYNASYTRQRNYIRNI